MVLPTLDQWLLTGKEMRRLIYEAGFSSPYSFAQYYAVNYEKVQRWLKLDQVPDGRLIGGALIGLRNQARLERVERELAAYKAKEGQQ